MKKNRWVLICLFIMCSRVLLAQEPNVFSIDRKALQKNKQRVQQKDTFLYPAYVQLLTDADKAMAFIPVSVMEKKNNPPSGDKHDYMSLAPYYWPDPSKADGLPYIRKDGETNPEVKDYKDKESMPKLCEAVNTLALAYYFSGKETYAEHAAQLIRVWFLNKDTKMNPNLNYAQAMKGTNTGRGIGIIDSRHFIKITDAVGLIQTSKYWSAKDEEGIQKWFADFLNWMRTSKNGIEEKETKNNHGDWYDAQCLSLALFTGNKEMAAVIITSAKDRIDKQIDEQGNLPLEMERTMSFHYTGFALEAFFNIAHMAELQQEDLWHYISPSKKSLQNAFTAYYPFLNKEKVWTGTQINTFDYAEAYPLLMAAVKKYNCTTCIATIKNIAGDKLDKLSVKLLTDIAF